MSADSKPRFPFPVPSGWFAVAFADELAPGALKSLCYFGRELVLFRGEDGAAHVLDAYCPHLGARWATQFYAASSPGSAP